MGSNQSRVEARVDEIEATQQARCKEYKARKDKLERTSQLALEKQQHTNQQLQKDVAAAWHFSTQLDNQQTTWNETMKDRVTRDEEIVLGYVKQQTMINEDQDQQLQMLVNITSLLQEGQHKFNNDMRQSNEKKEMEQKAIYSNIETLFKENNALKHQTEKNEERMEQYKGWIIYGVVGALALKVLQNNFASHPKSVPFVILSKTGFLHQAITNGLKLME